ncbi:MAG: PEP-CTERM sorting domain-containing protein [Planctomycetota bacterium]
MSIKLTTLGILTALFVGLATSQAQAAPLTIVETVDFDDNSDTPLGPLGPGANTVRGTLPFVAGQGDFESLIIQNPSSLEILSFRIELLSVEPSDTAFSVSYASTIPGFQGSFISGLPNEPVVIPGRGNTGSTLFRIESEPRGAGADYTATYLLTLEVVPEPSSLALLGLGGLLIARQRDRQFVSTSH